MFHLLEPPGLHPGTLPLPQPGQPMEGELNKKDVNQEIELNKKDVNQEVELNKKDDNNKVKIANCGIEICGLPAQKVDYDNVG